MKILIIFTVKLGFDGISSSVLNYYKYLDKTDMHIDFVAPNIVDNDIRNKIVLNGGMLYQFTVRNSYPLKYLYSLYKIIKANQYDIVHAHGNSATLAVEMLAAKLAGAPIRIAHSRNTTCTKRSIDKLLRPLFYKLYNQGFACSKEAGRWLFGNRPFYIITNGNDIEKYSYNEEIRQKIRKNILWDNKTIIGHVGSFNEQKNHEFLIDIFKELTQIDSNYVLVLVGDGRLRLDISSKVEKLGLKEKVVFMGISKEVEQLLQAMDIMVLPSLYEGLPNIIIESQIAGLPCIISDTITKECKITNLVSFMSLQESAYIWAEKIHSCTLYDRAERSDEIKHEIKEAGFDITENAKRLKEHYTRFLNEN